MAGPLRIALCGAAGRMGRRIASLAAEDGRFRISVGVDVKRPAALGSPIGPEDCGKRSRPAAPGFPFAPPSRLPERLSLADVLIDYSSPASAVRYVAMAAQARRPAVVGTTGFTPSQLKSLRASARRIPLLLAPNMSPGMNLLFELAKRAAAILPGYDAAVSETHHIFKKDAPSGSAKRLAEAVKEARGPKTAVPTVSLRAGGIVGTHTVLLAGPEERLELTHHAQSRDAFARGTLSAALWVRGKRPGLYSMQDMLRLR